MWQPGVNVGQGMEKTAVAAPATLWVGPMIGALAPDFKSIPPPPHRRCIGSSLTAGATRSDIEVLFISF